MQTIINWTRRPLVVSDDEEKRHTIKPGGSIRLNGDLSDHPWVKKKWLEIGTASGSAGDEGGEDDIEEIRQRYENIFGKKPHANAKRATLLQKIESWRDQDD